MTQTFSDYYFRCPKCGDYTFHKTVQRGILKKNHWKCPMCNKLTKYPKKPKGPMKDRKCNLYNCIICNLTSAEKKCIAIIRSTHATYNVDIPIRLIRKLKKLVRKHGFDFIQLQAYRKKEVQDQ